jgi:hypothetical protein
MVKISVSEKLITGFQDHRFLHNSRVSDVIESLLTSGPAGPANSNAQANLDLFQAAGSTEDDILAEYEFLEPDDSRACIPVCICSGRSRDRPIATRVRFLINPQFSQILAARLSPHEWL